MRASPLASRETPAQDDDRAPGRFPARFRLALRERSSALGRTTCLQLVGGEPLTPELGDARLRARKEERAAATGDDRRRTRVAWNAIAGAWLLSSTDAGAR